MTKNKHSKTIGIIGGMGPKATIDLYNEIVTNTKASTDQEHIPVLMHSIPQIPNRVKAILENGESPLPMLVKIAKDLKRTGAEVFIMPCNTAHFYQSDIEKQAGIKILSMIDETLSHIRKNYNGYKKVGLLATTAAIKTGVYNRDSRLEILAPDSDIQEKYVAQTILNIKNGDLSKKQTNNLKKAVKNLIEKGAEVIVMGCTEIPLVLSQKDIEIPLVNPTNILALKAIEAATKFNKKPSLLKKIQKKWNIFARNSLNFGIK